ncbi:MAG TPA: cytochrome c oxidase assembly protein [Streptosporangiaceae bacterium]
MGDAGGQGGCPGPHSLADSPPGADLRRWLPVAGAALVIASLVPPLSTLARRYLFVESIQFSLLAMVCPALIVLGAPWRRLRRARRGDDTPRRKSGAPPRLAPRRAASLDRWPAFLRGGVFLVVFIGVSLAWRVPPVLDALARHPGLVAAEAITLLAAGIGLWLCLVRSPSSAPPLSGGQRAAIAALAMWSTWIAAYALGFSSQPLVHAYAGDSGLGIVADQEIAVFLVWGVAGVCFVPVIFAGLFSWLKDSDDIGKEFRQAFPDASARVGVRGWQRPPRGPGTRSG